MTQGKEPNMSEFIAFYAGGAFVTFFVVSDETRFGLFGRIFSALVWPTAPFWRG